MRNESGNALFLILIAVALFAALSYAITTSGRGGGSIDKEQAELGASRLYQYVSSVKQGVDRVRFINGQPIENLDFRSSQLLQYDGGPNNWENTLCTTTSCQVYDPDGGGVSFQTFEDIAVDQPGWQAFWTMPGHSIVELMGIDQIGTILPELVIRVTGLLPEVCAIINKRASLPASPGYDRTGESYGAFRGDPTAKLSSTTLHTYGDDVDDLDGAYDFCIYSANTGWDYYHVLIAR